jgi:ribose 5-phosphate isomerase B
MVDERMATVAVGADHAGFALKQDLKSWLTAQGHTVLDFGTYSGDSVDYPDFAAAVSRAVSAGEAACGVLVCGTGIGMAIAANKVPGVYAAQVHDAYSAERARKSNNAQVMTLGARIVGPELAESLVRIWLGAEFQGGASARKVAKIAAAEARLGADPAS